MAMLGDIAVRLGLDVADFQKGLKDAENNMKNVGSKISNVGKDLTKKVTLPLVGVGVASIKVGADFEKSMAKVQAVTGASEKDFASLEGKARDLGSTTKYSAGEVADGMSFLGMAGFNTNEILDATGDMLNLASISGMDLASTADIASNMISGMGMDASEAGKIVDTMAYTMSNANVDVAMMGESFKYVAPVASDLGVDLGELSGAIGFLGDAGIQGGMAGTQLANGLTRLASPTDTAREMMKDLGIEAFTAEGELKSLPEVLGELEGGFKNLNPQEKTEVMKELFGQQNIKGWSALVTRGGDALEEFAGDINNADGAGQDMADTMNDTLYGQLLGMKSALEDVGISIYKMLEEPLKKVVEVITTVVRWIGDLDEGTLAFIVTLGAIVAVIPPILVVVGTMISLFGMLSGALAGTLSPILLIVAGITALGAGFMLAWQKSETFREVVTNAFNKMREVGVQVFEIIKTAVLENIQKIKDFWDENGESIKQAFTNVVKAIGKVFEVVFPIVKAIVIDTIKNIMNIISGLVDFVLGFVQMIAGIFTGDWKKAWEGMKRMVSGAIKAVWNFIQVWVVGKILKVFKLFGGKIGGALKNVGSKMLSPFKKGYTAVTKKVNSIKTNVVSKLKGMVTGIGSALKSVKNKITKPFTQAWDKVKGVPDKIKDIFGKLKIKIPKFKLPKISVTKGKKVMGISVPKLSVKWNAKGNIFNGATLLGGGQGVGEAGAEAVLPIQHKRYMKPFSSSIAEHLANMKNNGDTGSNVQNTFKIESLVVREEADVEKIAKALEKIQRKEQRAKGVFAY